LFQRAKWLLLLLLLPPSSFLQNLFQKHGSSMLLFTFFGDGRKNKEKPSNRFLFFWTRNEEQRKTVQLN
jgi:hypothetical protein